MEFSRQECWTELPFPTPGDLPDTGIKPAFYAPPALAADSLPLGHLGGPGDFFFFFLKKRNDVSFGFSSCLLAKTKTRWTAQTIRAFFDTFKSDNFHVRLLTKLLFSYQVSTLMLLFLLLQCTGVFQLAFQMAVGWNPPRSTENIHSHTSPKHCAFPVSLAAL